ncbi:putative non-specific serine/threonine protein kinase [Rosa chinensis]|uniref:Putative non-specific serine/threonine protein kinase n=1 Tax=Rosa chinensis TaxID=74649 RepID=A0A2P6SH91_ROSCH|nr:putative non-specific serine/threonine protein kinase [Rosa chinensis]
MLMLIHPSLINIKWFYRKKSRRGLRKITYGLRLCSPCTYTLSFRKTGVGIWDLGRWLRHADAISTVLLLHVNAFSSLGHHHAKVTIKCLEREREALLAIKQGLFNSIRLLSWGNKAKNQDCCKWEGAYCDHLNGYSASSWRDMVSSLDEILDFQHFEGKLCPRLIELQHLEYIDLNSIRLSQIPDFIGSLSNLRFLDLSVLRKPNPQLTTRKACI